MNPEVRTEKASSRGFSSWIPPEIERDPEQCRRARLAVGVAFSCIPAALLFGVVYAVVLPREAATPLVAITLAGVPVYAASLWLLPIFRTPKATVHTTLLCALLQVSLLAYALGGALSPVLAWLIPLPCMALVVCGRAAAVAWLALCLAVYGGFLASHPLATTVSPDHIQRLWFPSSIGMLAYTVSLFVLYERTKTGALRMLQAANRSLARARAEAQEANQSKSAFLSRMSHEIRTPLMAILGFTDLLSEGGDALRTGAACAGSERGRQEADEREALVTLRRNGEHLLHIIDDLLDLSRIEAEALRIERTRVDLAELVEGVLSLLRGRAAQRGIELRLEAESDLPEAFETDQTRLRQILVNLVGNALKFTECGSVTLRVRRSQSEEGSARLCFEVCDTGIGMTAEQVDQLFRPFGQAAPETARLYGGSGLGLAISKKLTEALGGAIRVSSEVGVGSTFRVELPLEASPDEPACSAAGPSEPAELPLAGRRILVVDDFHDNRVLLSHMLTRAGASVELADSGEAALESVSAAEASQRPFDVIVMDVQMPGMDGCAAASALRARNCRSIIVALTADALLSTRTRCLQSGFDAHATKPIQRDRLLSLARETVPAKRAPEPRRLAPTPSVAPDEAEGWWARLVLRCVPPAQREDREMVRRARMVLAFAVSPLPFLGIASWLMPRVFPQSTATLFTAMFLGVAPLCASVVCLLRMRGAVAGSGNLTLLYVLVVIQSLVLVSGGAASPANAWLAILPIWALPIVGARTACVWACVAFSGLAAAWLLDVLGGGLANRVILSQLPLGHFVSYGSLSCMLVILGLVYETAKDDSVARLAQLNDALARARDTANSAREAKERFLATVSHEMRTPMTAILGFAELLHEAWMRRQSTSGESLELLGKVEQNGARLLGLLNDVLDLSRIDAGRVELEQLRVWPAQLVQEALGPARALARSRGVRLRVKTAGGLPEIIQADPLRLRQLIAKLLEGAIDSAEKGTVVFRSRGEVSEQGIDMVFTLERADLAPSTPDGAWVGCWSGPAESGGLLPFTLARALCKLLGGQIDLHHDAAVGDVIHLRLPAMGVESASGQAAPSHLGAVRGEPLPSIRGVRVLLAEDSPDSQRLIAHVLRQAGACVDVAPDGRTAVERVLSPPAGSAGIDVVLMDMHMPILDGAQATRLLRSGGYVGPIVALTAEAPEVARERCLALGCDEFATKPIDRASLLCGIARAVARSTRG